MFQFSEVLIEWYLSNKRDLPWRETNEPYKIWLSEIILQQTRVAQGLPYYLNFLNKFPTVSKLANASEDEVLYTWKGLGYYSRARNLHFTAKFIHQNFNGNFPNNYKQLLKLKGVGDYTAAAIASFCFQEVVPVVDGNVYRVLSRLFDIQIPIDSIEGKKYFKNLAFELIDHKRPDLFNQAMMEFGALQCVPKKPNCNCCVLQNKCEAFEKNKMGELPVKSKKIKRKSRFFNYLIFQKQINNIYFWAVVQRNEKDIWAKLFEFPCLESPDLIYSKTEAENFLKNQKFPVYEIIEMSPYQKHILTHQDILYSFWKIKLNDNFEMPFEWKSMQDLKKMAFPKLLENYLLELEDNFLS